jgi:hypothetical protein
VTNVPPDISGFTGDFYYSLGDFLNLNCSTHNVSLYCTTVGYASLRCAPPFFRLINTENGSLRDLRLALNMCGSFRRDYWYLEKILQKIPVWEKISENGTASLIVISFNKSKCMSHCVYISFLFVDKSSFILINQAIKR